MKSDNKHRSTQGTCRGARGLEDSGSDLTLHEHMRHSGMVTGKEQSAVVRPVVN